MKVITMVCLVIVMSMARPALAGGPVETRIYLNEACVIADEPVVVKDLDSTKGVFLSGIVSTVAQAVLGNVVRGVAGLLESSGGKKNFVYANEQDLYLYRSDLADSPKPSLNRQLSCITLVAGEFEANDADCVGRYDPATLEMSEVSTSAIDAVRQSRGAANVLRRANICLAKPPNYVFESRMILSSDQASFRMENVGFEVNRLQSAKKDTDSRSLVAVYSLLEPSADGRGRLIASSWISHGEVQPGTKRVGRSPDSVSDWTRLPPISGASRAAWLDDSAPYRRIKGDISSLEGSVLGAIREHAALGDQLARVEEPIASEIEKARTRLDTKIAINTAKLAALREELDELPKIEQEYMLVKLRVSLTESRSEQAMKLWLSETLKSNSRLISRGLIEVVNQSED